MTINVRRIVLFLVLSFTVTLTAGCASDTSARDPKKSRTDEHQFHSDQEHYDRGSFGGRGP